MGEEGRLQKRIAKNLLVKLLSPTREFFGFVQDVAKAGLCVAVNRKVETGEPFQIELNVPRMKTMPLSGIVAWKREMPSISRNKFLIGMKLTKCPKEYEEYIDELLRHDYERRKEVRYRDVLEVQNDQVIDLLDAATSDVSAGGLYIRTGRPLPVGAQYELSLRGKGWPEPLMCLVEVLHTFECDPDDTDHAFGAGVRIISFKEGDKKRFTDYIKQLEAIYEFHWPTELAMV
jgi:hypothetical protein